MTRRKGAAVGSEGQGPAVHTFGAPVAGADGPTLLGIALVAASAWIALAVGVESGGAGAIGFVAGWTLMMTAMMLPSVAPLILLYRRGSSAAATARLAAGYLIVWSAVGLAAWALDRFAGDIPAAAVLGAAGVYQLTPAKHACLRRCRTPADFLVQRWLRSAVSLGVEHGVWCLGCCWALMAVLVVAAMMSLLWVVVIAAVVAIEKLATHGVLAAHLTGVALIALARLEGVS